MNRIGSITIYDRYKKTLVTERVFAARFLSWMYNTTPGSWTTTLLIRQKFVTQFYGWLHKRSCSRRKIKSFVEKLNVNVSEALQPSESFRSFNDFFIREIDMSRRPINQNSNVCVAPVDGRVLAFPRVDGAKTFRIKRSTFNLQRFLANTALAGRFEGGSMVICRLYLSDYHHVHFPDSGIPKTPTSISGKYQASGPYSLMRAIPFYTENHRMVTLFDSDNFGEIAIVEIGALTVGSISQRFQPGVHVTRGEKKGFFELGGSTVVLLFQPGVIHLDEDLCSNTEKEIETYVRLGDSIGKA